MAVLSGFAVVIGLCVGSFLNVCIYRIPNDLSIVRPASRCPSCGHPIRPYDNIPVLSWILLRGRCRDCGTAISSIYPAIELLTGIVALAPVPSCDPRRSGARRGTPRAVGALLRARRGAHRRRLHRPALPDHPVRAVGLPGAVVRRRVGAPRSLRNRRRRLPATRSSAPCSAAERSRSSGSRGGSCSASKPSGEATSTSR